MRDARRPRISTDPRAALPRGRLMAVIVPIAATLRLPHLHAMGGSVLTGQTAPARPEEATG